PGSAAVWAGAVPAGRQTKTPWPALAGGALRFCVLAVAGEATAAALARYVGAAGYTVLQRDARLTTDEIAQAALICADADRLATFDLPADRRRPPLIPPSPLAP